MQLDSLTYSEHKGTPQEWTLNELSLCKRNLIVGKNASGKTRTLNVIGALAQYLAGLRVPAPSSNYDCKFNHKGKIYKYTLTFQDQQVVHEKLLIDDRELLSRGAGGVGTIFSEQIEGGKTFQFQTPTSELAVAARRDNIQHSFLEPLYSWASSVRHYYFGSNLGKDTLTVFHPGTPKVNDRDQNAVAPIFRNAINEFPQQFTDTLIKDLASIDYYVEEIEVAPPVSILFEPPGSMPGNALGLCVKEKDLPGITDQFSMSQGMFRVLSLLIQINYFQLKNTATCIIIDDIGEGLDFDRSCRLIELLRSKTNNSELQIIMSTNDRFVMNSVPLEEWSVLQRAGNRVSARNHINSRKIFEDFKFTGLSNFSFLELDVLNNPPEEDNITNA